jgi:membrane fusion protein (multidrug efflux system)
MEEQPATSPAKPLPPPRRKRGRTVMVIVTLAGAALLMAAILAYYFRFIAPYESTDDAFIQGNAAFISARISGQVERLMIDDNQRVKTGDPLLEIDDRDFQTQLALARANLAAARNRVLQAKAQIAVDQAKAEQQLAAVAGVEAIASQAEADRARYQSVQSNAVSRSQVDLVRAEAVSSSANVEVARIQAKAAAAQVDLDRADLDTAQSQVGEFEANLRQAELNVSYARVVAPRDGRVTRRTVEQGAYIQIGQALLAIVPDYVWVVANFKETQIENIRAGQPVTIEIDAYPHRTFKAHVDSLQAGSGANFSLLPPENAVGNYVKVVQRVPVKIVFDEALPPELDVAPGMSVDPRVKVK